MEDDVSSIGERHDEYDTPAHLERHRVTRVLLARWKHAIVAAVVALTAWILYDVTGGWTIDATVFGIAAAGIVVYSLLTLRSDFG